MTKYSFGEREFPGFPQVHSSCKNTKISWINETSKKWFHEKFRNYYIQKCFLILLLSIGTRSKALEKLTAIQAKDGFSENLTSRTLSEVYSGLEGISENTFLKNIFNLQVFWSQKEIARALGAPTFEDDVNKLGFDTSLVSSFLVHTNNNN